MEDAPQQGTDQYEQGKEPTKYTKTQREAITKVLQCHEEDYFRILDLPESCTLKDVKNRYKKLSLVIHPDKNDFSDATRAFRS
jgi:hypothetical protein